MSSGPLRANAISGLRWTTAARVITQIVTWSATIWVVRLLTPADYGLVAIATLVSGYLMIWNELGVGVVIIHRRIVDKETLGRIFNVLICVGAGLALLSIAVAPVLAHAFHDPRVGPLAALVSIHFLVMPFAIIPQSQLSMQMRFSTVAKLNLSSAIVGSLSTLGLAALHFGANALVLGTIASALFRTLGLCLLTGNYYLPRMDFRGVKSFMSQSGLILLERTVWYWYSQLDTLIVGRMHGVSALGLYSMGSQLAMMPMDRASEVVNAVALPAYASVKEDSARVRDGYLKALRVGSALVFPLFWGLAAVAGDLIPLVLGAKWATATLVFQLLCLVMPVRTLGTLASPLLMAIGKIRLALWFAICAAVLVATGLLIGAHWGIAGVALAWVAAYPLAFMINAAMLGPVIGAPRSAVLLPIAVPLICSAVMSALVYWLMRGALFTSPVVWKLAIAVPVGIVTYVALLALLAYPRFREVMSILRSVLTGR